MIPLGFDLLVLLFERQQISWQVIFSDPSTYLIGFGITANGLGEAVFGKRHTGQAPLGYISLGYISLGYIIAIVLSVFVLVVGAAMYALAKAVAENNPLPFWVPACYGLVAVGVSLITAWISER